LKNVKTKGAKMKSIKELREHYGYTQKQFADLLDVTINTVQKWEQGTRFPGRRSKKDIKNLFSTEEEIDQLFSEGEN